MFFLTQSVKFRIRLFWWWHSKLIRWWLVCICCVRPFESLSRGLCDSVLIFDTLCFSLLLLAQCRLSVVNLAYGQTPLCPSFVGLRVVIPAWNTCLHRQIQIWNRTYWHPCPPSVLSFLLFSTDQVCFKCFFLAFFVALIHRFHLNKLLEHVWQYADALFVFICFLRLLLYPEVDVLLLLRRFSASGICCCWIKSWNVRMFCTIDLWCYLRRFLPHLRIHLWSDKPSPSRAAGHVM